MDQGCVNFSSGFAKTNIYFEGWWWEGLAYPHFGMGRELQYGSSGEMLPSPCSRRSCTQAGGAARCTLIFLWVGGGTQELESRRTWEARSSLHGLHDGIEWDYCAGQRWWGCGALLRW